MGVREYQGALSVVPARLALGSSMIHHGRTKLSMEGAAKTGQAFHQMGIRPGRFWAVATGTAEVFAGVASILGLGTRVAALAVLVTQTVAIAKVHKPKGFDITRGGYEYNLTLMAIALGMLVAGPGDVSAHRVLDRLVARRRRRGLLRWVRGPRSIRAVPRVVRAIRLLK
jgi:putative oxidoreductase